MASENSAAPPTPQTAPAQSVDAAEFGSELVGVAKSEFGASDHNKAVLEQYKMFVDSTDKVSTRRMTANTFFLTLNTGLVGALGFALRGEFKAALAFACISAAAIGIVTCLYWRRLLQSYKDLNRAKFRVIDLVEDQLPLRPFRIEWKMLGQGKDPTKYHEATKIEMTVPVIFGAVYVVLAIGAVVALAT